MTAPAPFLPQEVVRRKRDGETLTPEEIACFVDGIVDGSVGDAQVAALAMAVHFRGMDAAECVALTEAMTRSGVRLAWDDLGLDGPVLDKHSTGGAGDKVSLVLAPLLAACGAYVPMISGRGLGHTGGTLDKLESIPGYDARPTIEAFRRAVQAAGCAIVGQTGQVAPADARFYAIRDVTATVEPIALITASILSKKLAAGLDALVMDVKVGSGAVTRSHGEARVLAETIMSVAARAGLPTHALLTDMDQVLGTTAGNAVEVREAIAYLTGGPCDPRLRALVNALGAELLFLGGLVADREEGTRRMRAAHEDGRGAERLARMVAALGGPADLLEKPGAYLPVAPVRRPVVPPRPGCVRRVDARALGLLVVELGGGRRDPADGVDPAVGLSDVLGVGGLTDGERPLAVVHARREADARRAVERVRAAMEITDDPVMPGPVVHDFLTEVRP